MAPAASPEVFGGRGSTAVSGGGAVASPAAVSAGGVFERSRGLDASHPNSVAHGPSVLSGGVLSGGSDAAEAGTASEVAMEGHSPVHGSSDNDDTSGGEAISRSRPGKRRASTMEGHNPPSLKRGRDENGPVRRQAKKATVLRRRPAGQCEAPSSSSPLSPLSPSSTSREGASLAGTGVAVALTREPVSARRVRSQLGLESCPWALDIYRVVFCVVQVIMYSRSSQSPGVGRRLPTCYAVCWCVAEGIMRFGENMV